MNRETRGSIFEGWTSGIEDRGVGLLEQDREVVNKLKIGNADAMTILHRACHDLDLNFDTELARFLKGEEIVTGSGAKLVKNPDDKIVLLGYSEDGSDVKGELKWAAAHTVAERKVAAISKIQRAEAESELVDKYDNYNQDHLSTKESVNSGIFDTLEHRGFSKKDIRIMTQHGKHPTQKPRTREPIRKARKE